MKLGIIVLRLLAVLMLLVVASGAFAQSDSQKYEPREYTEENPLVYEDAWDLWPYVFLDDNGKPTGYNVELLSLLFKELDIPFVIRLKPTSQALEDLLNGQSDLMLGMMAGFHDDYTRHYGKTVVHLFTHSVAHPSDYKQTVHNISDLATQQVIVHTGSFSHHMMQDHGWGLNAQPFDDMGLAIQIASAENSGQVLWNTMSLKWLIHKYHALNLTLSPVDIPSGEYRFMSNDSTLLAKLDEAYSILKASDRLQPLEMKWFYPEEAAENETPAWLWYVVYGLCIIALLLTIASVVYHLRERRATADGRRRINRLALVLKTCQVKIWTYEVGKDFVRWYGDDARTQEMITTTAFARRYWPAEVDQLHAAIQQLIDKEKEEVSLQMHITDVATADMENHIFSVTLSVLESIKGKPAVIICTERDATEEINKQRKANELMSRYRAVFSTAMVDMIYCNSQGDVINMNKRAQRTFHTTLTEARTKHYNVKDFFPDDDVLSYRYATLAMTADGTPLPENQHPNAESRFYEMQVLPVFDRDQKPLGVLTTGREVTEVARTYVQLTKGLKDLRQALDELGEYVNNINYVLQVGGVRIVTYSPDTHEFTIFHRMHEVQYMLTQQRCIELTDAESLPQVMRLIRTMDRRTKVSCYGDIRTRLRVKGGQTVCLLVQMFPVVDKQGHVTAYEGVCRDVTEIKHTEQQLKLETEKAQEVEQLKMKFLHNMCFAIRTPLDIVVKSAEMFEREHDPADEPACIDTIKENSAYLLKLVNDILFLSRLDAKMVESTKRETDFAKAIDGLCHNGWLEGRRDGVIYDVENLYEQLVLIIDLTNLGRILEQLLHNAVQHTYHGRVRVRYEYIGGRLVLGVDDTGEGISKDVLEHIFERFNTPSGNNSTGLGLPICKELASLMGGNIDITSEVGKGTTVWVTIPCEVESMVRK